MHTHGLPNLVKLLGSVVLSQHWTCRERQAYKPIPRCEVVRVDPVEGWLHRGWQRNVRNVFRVVVRVGPVLRWLGSVSNEDGQEDCNRQSVIFDQLPACFVDQPGGGHRVEEEGAEQGDSKEDEGEVPARWTFAVVVLPFRTVANLFAGIRPAWVRVRARVRVCACTCAYMVV